NLPQIPLPAILHWEGDHWVVLYDVRKSHVRIDDPALGPRRIPNVELALKWSGYAALFDYTEAFDRAPEARPTLSRLAPFFEKYHGVLSQVFLLAALVTSLQLLFPIFTQLVVDK